MQSFFSTHYLRFVLRKWYIRKLGKNYTTRYISQQGYRVLYLHLIRNMEVRIHRIPMRKNPPTIKAKSVCTGKLVAHFSRIHVVNTPERVSDISAGKPVAETLATEFQVFLTPPFSKWAQIAKKQLNGWFNNLKIIRTETCCHKTSRKRRRSIHSVKSRITWSPIWAIPKSSSSTRLLRRNNARIAPWNLEVGIFYGKCGKCLQPTEGNRQMNKQRFDVLSIPGYVIKKDHFHGARHGPSMRPTMYFKAHDILRKARSNKNGNF